MSWLLLVFLGFMAVPAARGQFTTTTNDGVITISRYIGSELDVAIPASINGLPVVNIGQEAFAYIAITNVTIPGSVTNIEDMAFLQCSLTSVVIPDGVISIGTYAFFECFYLTNVTLPESLVDIEDFGFEYCPLPDVFVPASVTNIGAGAFTGCGAINVEAGNPVYSSLSGVLFNHGNTVLLAYPGGSPATAYTLPHVANAIADFAFEGCDNLTTVTIPNTVTNIGQSALAYCFNLTNVTLPGNLTAISPGLFDSSALSAITIPSSVTQIGDYAFESCPLAGVTIPDAVTNIGSHAFDRCPLTNVLIPANVASIGTAAFGGSAAISVNQHNTSYTSIDGVLFSADQTVLVEYPTGNGATSYTIPGGTVSIGTQAFDYSPNLAAVTIPGTVTRIEAFAFTDCFFTSLIIPGSVTNIGDEAFAYCSILKGVYFSGDAPAVNSTAFTNDTATVYYLPGTAGWGSTSGGIPTAFWTLPYPLILNNGTGFGLSSNQFIFNVSWATNNSVVIEACTNLVNPIWQALQTNSPTNGWFSFRDFGWTNYPKRFYRVRSL